MSDPNLVDFYDRVSRFERARSHGFAHQAGVTSDSFPVPRMARVTRRRSVLLPLLFVTFAAFALKGAILHSVGTASYDDRVARLQAGEGFDRLGGWLMQADPVTRFMAGQIGHGLAQIRN